jgi:hypothetical protein
VALPMSHADSQIQILQQEESGERHLPLDTNLIRQPAKSRKSNSHVQI